MLKYENKLNRQDWVCFLFQKAFQFNKFCCLHIVKCDIYTFLFIYCISLLHFFTWTKPFFKLAYLFRLPRPFWPPQRLCARHHTFLSQHTTFMLKDKLNHIIIRCFYPFTRLLERTINQAFGHPESPFWPTKCHFCGDKHKLTQTLNYD